MLWECPEKYIKRKINARSLATGTMSAIHWRRNNMISYREKDPEIRLPRQL